MPRFNQRGPEGQGPVSGKGRGMCQRTDYSAFTNIGGGRGRGMGSGGGMGSGMGRTQTSAVQTAGSKSDLDALKAQYESALKMIEELQKKITGLEAQQK